MLASASAGRTIPPGAAFLIITAGALAGPLIAGTAVAHTIGHDIVNYRTVGFLPLTSGLFGGMLAILIAFAARVPTSASVALVSATVGSLWVAGEMQKIMWSGVAKVGFSLFGSIVVGFIAGAFVYTLACLAFVNVSLQTGRTLMRLQYVTVALQALGYGSNDAEKMMGLIAAATTIGSGNAAFVVPLWVIGISVAAFAVGMALGGTRVAKTVGGKLFSIRPLHALSFQTAASLTVLTASVLGGPLSTTESTASAIMGVGAAANPRALRWQVARDMVAAWLLTVPIGLVCGAAATIALRSFIHGGR